MDMAGVDTGGQAAREAMSWRVDVVYRSSFVTLRPLSISPRGQATETLLFVPPRGATGEGTGIYTIH